MVNQSKTNDPRFWAKWKESGAISSLDSYEQTPNGIFEGPRGRLEFYDREGNLFRPEKVAKAYAFFNLDASKQEIAKDLPKTRDAMGLPSQLELSIKDMRDFVKDPQTDPKLINYINRGKTNAIIPSNLKHLKGSLNPVKVTDLNYVIEARHPNYANDMTAQELSRVMAGLQDTFAYEKPFYTDIVAQLDGQYMVME